jgi:SAM-dependent methyltransferase
VKRAIRNAARDVLHAVNRPVASLRFRRALPRVARPFALEIGGRAPRPGWVVTDVSAITRHYLDATRRWPIEDGALTHVYADNMIEHISLDGGRAFIREAFRCLQPGGRIRIVTPDIELHVRTYLDGRAALASDVATRYKSHGLTLEHAVDLVRIPIGEFRHHEGYVYDFDALTAELTNAGFRDPLRLDAGVSDDPQFVDLEQRTDPGHGQLVVEATK